MTPLTPVVGQVLPTLTRTLTLTDLVTYAGATWDWHKLHYDLDYVTSKKLPAPIVDGQVLGAFLVEQLQDWAGPDCFVQKLSFAFKALVFAGETIRCEGSVTGVEEGVVVVEQQVVVVGADGQASRVAVAPARATVLLGHADGPGADPVHGGRA